jgi:hypothetical protein
LENALLAKFASDYSFRDLLMVVARCCPGCRKFAIIDQPCLLETEDHRLGNIIFNATCLKVSEKLALTLCSRYQRIERDSVSNFVRVRALAAFYLGKLERN